MESSQSIDRKSFILGMVTAFAECVANECKKVAFSPPFYPEDYETVLQGVENIANDQGLSVDGCRSPGTLSESRPGEDELRHLLAGPVSSLYHLRREHPRRPGGFSIPVDRGP